MNNVRNILTEMVLVTTLVLTSSYGFAATSNTCSMTVSPRISAGYAHTDAIKTDGSLAAWGKNNSGQLGDGTTVDSHVPKAIGAGYAAIASGTGPDTAFTIAVKTDRSLWAWGNNTHGQLGDGTTNNSLSPKQIGTDTTYAAVAAGYYHSLARKTDGSLWAWGRNDHGQLGDGTAADSPTPKQVGTDTGYAAIAAGESHNLALKSDGSLWAWGKNDHGQLGDGTESDSLVPKLIGAGYSTIAAGKYHTVALKSDGSLWTWGYNEAGQLGDGTLSGKSTPRQVGAATNYTAIAAGFGHTVALTSGGDLWAWGNNLYGSLGDGTNLESLVPKLIGSGYATITAGNYHTVALKTDGSLWTWGDNGFGQVGDGTTTSPVTSPKKIITTGFTAPDFTAPSAPSVLIAKQAGAGADLSWSASTDNVAVKAYFVFRDGILVGSPTSTSYKDTGLIPSTSYVYAVTAFDASCNISPSTATSLTTSSDTQVPMVPADMKASPSTTGTGVDLAWTASIDDVGVASYKVYRGNILLPSQGLGNVTRYTDNDSSLIGSTEYSYTVAACDAAGYCSAPGPSVSVITPQRLAVNSLSIASVTALPRSTNTIELTWTASTPASTYNIYRNGALVGNSFAMSYSDTGLIASSSYSYSVAACDAGGSCTAQSAPVSAITLQYGALDSTQLLSDCLFNWAELTYTTLFAPRGSPSKSDGPYYWRSYSQTGAYLAVSSGKLYYLGPLSSNTSLDLGASATWYSKAGCQ